MTPSDSDQPRRAATAISWIGGGLLALPLVLAIAGAARAAYLARIADVDVRVFVSPHESDARVALDDGPSIVPTRGIARLSVPRGDHVLTVTGSQGVVKRSLTIRRGAAHAVSGSDTLCFVFVDARGRYGASGPNVGGITKRLRATDVELPESVVFDEADLPAAMSSAALNGVGIVRVCHCKDLDLSDELLERQLK